MHISAARFSIAHRAWGRRSIVERLLAPYELWVGAHVTVPPSKPCARAISPLYELTVEHVIAVRAGAWRRIPATEFSATELHSPSSVRKRFSAGRSTGWTLWLMCAPLRQSPCV